MTLNAQIIGVVAHGDADGQAVLAEGDLLHAHAVAIGGQRAHGHHDRVALDEQVLACRRNRDVLAHGHVEAERRAQAAARHNIRAGRSRLIDQLLDLQRLGLGILVEDGPAARVRHLGRVQEAPRLAEVRLGQARRSR